MQTESEWQISDINLRISNATLAFTWEHDANRYEKLHHSITSMLQEAENALSAVQLVTTTTYCHGLLGHLDKVSQSCGRLHRVTWWCEISSADLRSCAALHCKEITKYSTLEGSSSVDRWVCMSMTSATIRIHTRADDLYPLSNSPDRSDRCCSCWRRYQ